MLEVLDLVPFWHLQFERGAFAMDFPNDGRSRKRKRSKHGFDFRGALIREKGVGVNERNL